MATKHYVSILITYTVTGARQWNHAVGTMRDVELKAAQFFRTAIRKGESQRIAFNRLAEHAARWIDSDRGNNGNHINHTLLDYCDETVV